jgi:hypothetical protein
LPKNRGSASGESMGCQPRGWDEAVFGAASDEAPVDGCGGAAMLDAMPIDSICRTAVYVIRMHGGVGGGSREAFPYPDSAPLAPWNRSAFEVAGMTERCSSSNDIDPATLAGLNGSGSCDKSAPSRRRILSQPRRTVMTHSSMSCCLRRERGRTVAGAARSAASALDRLASLRDAPRSRAPLSSRCR